MLFYPITRGADPRNWSVPIGEAGHERMAEALLRAQELDSREKEVFAGVALLSDVSAQIAEEFYTLTPDGDSRFLGSHIRLWG